MKIHFTYSNEKKEGFESFVPMATGHLPNDSVDEIYGTNVLEKVPNLVHFIEECYRLLKTGSKAGFTSPHYGSAKAWAHPLNIRAISEMTLNFSDKKWREDTKFTDVIVLCDFEVAGGFAVEELATQRSDEARTFWIYRYLNVCQAVVLTITKREYIG